MNQKQILALSFDRPTFPNLELLFADAQELHRFKFASYKKDGRNATIITRKVNQGNSQSVLHEILNNDRYLCASNLFGIGKNIYRYVANNRHFLCVISLHESMQKPQKDFFLQDPVFPIGIKHHSKTYASWLVKNIASQTTDHLSDMPWPAIYELFSRINADNPCSIILTDGQDMIFYQGNNFSNSLYYLRSCPPHDNNPLFNSNRFCFHLDGIDLNHSLILFSSSQIAHNNSKYLNLGQMVVVRSGEMIWDNDPAAHWEQANVSTKSLIPSKNLQQIRLVEVTSKSSKKAPKKVIALPTEAREPDISLYSIHHKTIYSYDAPVRLSKHLFRLQPLHDLTQSLLKYDLSILIDGKPVNGLPCNFSGAFGNYATHVEVDESYQKMEVISNSIVGITPSATKRFDLLHLQRTIPLIWMPWDKVMLQAYLVPPELPESELRELSDYALSFISRNNGDIYAVLNDINRTIFKDYTYLSGSTSPTTTAYDVYANHRGVCQDFANLFICLARLLNIPARYRTGYIYTATDYVNQAQGDASHAWLEVYLPYIGWVGYDPTNFCLAGKNHIRIACGRTYTDTAPTSGTIFRGGGSESLTVTVHVVKLSPPIDYNELT